MRPPAHARSSSFLRFSGCGAMLVLLALSRRPEVLDTPAFYAEEGSVFYVQAWHDGPWRPFVRYQDGYLQTLTRTVAALSLAVPLVWAPRLFILFGAAVQALPGLFLLSRRMAAVIPSFGWRLAMAVSLIALPHAFEVCAAGLLGYWHLTLLAFLVIIVRPPERKAERAFDIGVVTLAVLSGASNLVLPLVAGWWWFGHRRRWTLVLLGAMALPFALQVVGWVATDGRASAPSQASLGALIRILGGQVFLSPLVGLRPAAFVASREWGGAVLTTACFVGVAFVGYAIVRGPDALRALWFLALLIVVSALSVPLAIDGPGQWAAMETPGVACRYWFVPGIATMATVFWGLGRLRSRWGRTAAVAALGVFVLAAILHWRVPTHETEGFIEGVRRFEEAPPGTEVVIPVWPPPWTMTLRK